MDLILIVGFIIGAVIFVVAVIDIYSNKSEWFYPVLTTLGLWFGFNAILLIIGVTVFGKPTNNIEYESLSNRYSSDTIIEEVEVTVNNQIVALPIGTSNVQFDVVCRVTINQSYRLAMILGNSSSIELRKPCSEVTEIDYQQKLQPIIESWK